MSITPSIALVLLSCGDYFSSTNSVLQHSHFSYRPSHLGFNDNYQNYQPYRHFFNLVIGRTCPSNYRLPKFKYGDIFLQGLCKTVADCYLLADSETFGRQTVLTFKVFSLVSIRQPSTQTLSKQNKFTNWTLLENGAALKQERCRQKIWQNFVLF